jgi:hypothetical protein
MDDNTKAFFDKIQEIKEKKIKIYLLSQNKQVDCDPLSFKQQKELISTVADGMVGALKFQKYLNDTITQNIGQDISLSDRLPIILQLRMDSIGTTIKHEDDVVDLTPSLEKSKELTFKNKKTIKGDITIQVEVPTLKEENQVIQASIDLLKKDGDSEMGKNVGNIYTYEIVKFIKSLKFGEQELVFKDIPVRDRVKIVENLPLSQNKQVIEFIQEIKEKENSVMEIEKDGKKVFFDIDVNFFNS